MTAQLLTADLAGMPGALNALADRLARRDPFEALPALVDDEPAGIVLLGTGSARHACEAAAHRLRRAGLGATAEHPSAEGSLPPGPATLVVAVAVGGGLRELCTALDRYVGGSAIIVITDDANSPAARYADILAPLGAEPEKSGLNCRGHQLALALLLHLGHRLGAPPLGGSADLVPTLRRSANASADLLERARAWVPGAAAALGDGAPVHAVAPAERGASAEQASLVLRQGPVLASFAFETAEWSHTGRYLAAVSDYRALLFTGSHYDERFSEHLLQLRGRFVAVGGEVAGAADTVRYLGDADPDVALLTEPLVAEILAAHWWAARGV
ncbi:SIS domain-containing protein [Nocardiopsis baichengensis]|uniref:SIS domain-containing protein n=1 Tax=Nocardiopsis baichengensis TaxID=280240 RepID=UPI00034D02C3|nr:SIS domain-containing protein [Nocardiopsis baichengensis]